MKRIKKGFVAGAILFPLFLLLSCEMNAETELIAQAPSFSLPSGTYEGTQLLAIRCDTDEAVIYYTIDGSEPSTSSDAYMGPITIDRNMTVKAMASRADWDQSAVAAASYVIAQPLILFSPPEGAYSEPLAVSIGLSVEGLSVYYTTDGSDPSVASRIYGGETIAIGASTVVSALIVDGETGGEFRFKSSYRLYSATPEFTLAGGTYSSGQYCEIACASGGTVYYTTDGAVPTVLSAKYTGRLTIDRSMTLRAVAVKNGWETSSIRTADYEMRVPSPEFSLESGEYKKNTPLRVTTTGSRVYYTTDGTVPTLDSPYSVGALELPLTACGTVTALAVREGWSDSAIESESYVVWTAEVFAGDGWDGCYDAVGTLAQFDNPTEIAVDSGGNLFVSDSANNKIRKIDPDRRVTTVAGNQAPGFVDGDASTVARLNGPLGMYLSDDGTLYFIDRGNHALRKLTVEGEIVTLAGTGIAGYADGDGSVAQFNGPTYMTGDGNGAFYVTDADNYVVRKVVVENEGAGVERVTVSTLAGWAGVSGYGDGLPEEALFSNMLNIEYGSDGMVYQLEGKRIRRIDLNGNVSSLSVGWELIPWGTFFHFALDAEQNIYFSYCADNSANYSPSAVGFCKMLLQEDGSYVERDLQVYSTGLSTSQRGGIGFRGMAFAPDGDIFLTQQFTNKIARMYKAEE